MYLLFKYISKKYLVFKYILSMYLVFLIQKKYLVSSSAKGVKQKSDSDIKNIA